MQISTRYQREATILRLSGRFDFRTQKKVQAAVRKADQSKPQHIIFNLEEVSFIDSCALGLLAMVRTNLDKTNTRASLVVPQSDVLRILNLADFSSIIPIFSTEQESVSALSTV